MHVAGSSTENALNINGTFIINGTTGRVGIGTASPTASLHVAGGSTVNALNVNGTFIINGTTGSVVPGANNTGGIGTDLLRWASIYGVSVYSGDVIFENKFRITEGDKFGEETGSLVFVNSSSEKIMKLDSQGNLWIKGEVRRL